MTRFVLSALLLTLSLGLAGCGGGGSSAAETPGEPCGSRVAVYQSESMSRIDVYQMPLLVVAEQEIPQQGMFVFHGGDGQSAYLVSRGIDADSDRFFVSVLR